MNNTHTQKELEIYCDDQALLSELPSVGYGIFTSAAVGGTRPSDEHAYEICYIDAGSIEWWVEDTLCEYQAGTTFLNRPGEWHGGQNALLHPCAVYWVQFNFPPAGQLPGLAQPTIAALSLLYATMSPRNFRGSDLMRGLFQRLLIEYRQPQAHSSTMARALFHQILIQTTRDYQARHTAHYSEPIAQALIWMHAHLADDFRIEDVARAVGLSLSYLHQCFLQELGIPPAEYHMRQRIQQAKRALRQPHTITHIAHSLGFSTSQYFATVFKRYTGLSPTAYRELMFSNAD